MQSIQNGFSDFVKTDLPSFHNYRVNIFVGQPDGRLSHSLTAQRVRITFGGLRRTLIFSPSVNSLKWDAPLPNRQTVRLNLRIFPPL